MRPALEAILKTAGPTRFRLLETRSVRSLDGEMGATEGRSGAIEQRISEAEGVLVGDIQLHLRAAELRTRVRLDPGQLLVLGEVGVNAADFGARPNAEGPLPVEQLYVIVRADLR